jgi:hypothetical protein
MSTQQKSFLLLVLMAFLEILLQGPLAACMHEIETFLGEKYFCWIGGFHNEDPCYYRIQSPIICVEFDNYAGVFLLNGEQRPHSHAYEDAEWK